MKEETDNSWITTIRDPSACEAEKKLAYEKLYLKYQVILEKYARHLGASVESAEDYVQETLLRALVTKVDQFEIQEEGSFKSWVCTILRNLYFNDHKRHKIENRITTEIREDESFNPFDSLNYNEDIYRSAGLSLLETEVIILSVDYGLKPSETAHIMSEHSPENISRIIYRAKQKIRQILDT